MPKKKYYNLDDLTLDNLIEGYQLIGFDWRYLYVNDAVVKQSKYDSKDDLLGYTMMEKYPDIEKTELFKVLEWCMNNRSTNTMINEFTFPDNSKGWFELRIEPVPKGLFILSMDITDRKIAEKKKKEYTNSLEEIIYTVSHNIRKPICNMMGMFDLVNETKNTKGDLIKISNFLKTDVKELDQITRQLTKIIQENKIRLDS